MLKILTLVIALGVAAGCTITTTTGPGPVVGVPGAALEPNVNRPGADYRSLDLGAPRPEDCQAACMADQACVAFTYVNPGLQGPNARCWLKNQVTPPMADGCCVSGTKFGGGEPPGQSAWVGTPPPPPAGAPSSAWRGVPPTAAPQAQLLELNMSRPGLDYRSFDLPYPRPEDCRAACMAEPQCQAFTYVNPGVQGPGARCWLKSQVPQPVPDACCVSGVK